MLSEMSESDESRRNSRNWSNRLSRGLTDEDIDDTDIDEIIEEDVQRYGEVTDIVATDARLGITYERTGHQWGWCWDRDRTTETLQDIINSAIGGDTPFTIFDAAKVIGAVGIALIQAEMLDDDQGGNLDEQTEGVDSD